MPAAGKPKARAEGIRFVAREATRIPSPHGSGFPATGHDGLRPPAPMVADARAGHDGLRLPAPMVADARCREARGASRGNAVRCMRSDAYSLTSRFGLPGNRTRRSETAGTDGDGCQRRARRSETAGTDGGGCPLPGSPRREPRECGSLHEKRRVFPHLTVRASRQPGSTVRDRSHSSGTTVTRLAVPRRRGATRSRAASARRRRR
jgi:hypothetical protein